ncbi:MAG TPA: hypothetical protein VKV73_19900 [Chloroflexota bacterium]|nr:hypothetical protein [Chloroflexota bacterium]
MPKDLDALAQLLDQAIRANPDLSQRKVSRLIGKEDSWMGHFVNPPGGIRRMAAPDIESLRTLGSLLHIPLHKLVSLAYGVDVDELLSSMDSGAYHGPDGPLHGLSQHDQEEIKDFAAYLRMKATQRRPATPRPIRRKPRKTAGSGDAPAG